MCHRDNLDTSGSFAKHNQVRKLVEHRSAGSQFMRLILLRVLRNQIDCSLEFTQKRIRGAATAVSVPFRGGVGLIKGGRMDPDTPARHRYG
jgi:hypothetical protein